MTVLHKTFWGNPTFGVVLEKINDAVKVQLLDHWPRAIETWLIRECHPAVMTFHGPVEHPTRSGLGI